MNKRRTRTNISPISIKLYLQLFFFLLVICGGYSGIFLHASRGKNSVHSELLSLEMLVYVFVISISVCIVFYLVKRRFIDLPIRKLQNAAQKVANGDFTVRVSPYRKDGKKDEIEVLYEDFNKMIGELASTETLKTDFISSVSHEIKTPIAVIENYASYLQSEDVKEFERNCHIKTIVHAAQSLSVLVNDILSMNKLEHLEIIPQGHLYSLDEQIRKCVVIHEDLWSRKDINVSANLVETMVTYNEGLLELIWNNLISNAIKFTKPGGEILIDLRKDNNNIIFNISDTGCGISEDILKHIFDKFYQGDTSHSKEGNGLGLAMVKKVCDLYHASLSVKSSPDKGTTFTVILKNTNI